MTQPVTTTDIAKTTTSDKNGIDDKPESVKSNASTDNTAGTTEPEKTQTLPKVQTPPTNPDSDDSSTTALI